MVNLLPAGGAAREAKGAWRVSWEGLGWRGWEWEWDWEWEGGLLYDEEG